MILARRGAGRIVHFTLISFLDLCLIYFFITDYKSRKIAGRRWTWASLSEYLLLWISFLLPHEKRLHRGIFFCSFIHDFLGVNNIEDLFCVNFNAKKKNSLHAIIAYKNYSNTRKGNFSLAPHHLQGRKLTCQLKIKWCLKSLTYLLCNHKSPLA